MGEEDSFEIFNGHLLIFVESVAMQLVHFSKFGPM